MNVLAVESDSERVVNWVEGGALSDVYELYSH